MGGRVKNSPRAFRLLEMIQNSGKRKTINMPSRAIHLSESNRKRLDKLKTLPSLHNPQKSLRHQRYNQQLDERHGRGIAGVKKFEADQVSEEGEGLAGITGAALSQDVDEIERFEQIDAAQQNTNSGHRQDQG